MKLLKYIFNSTNITKILVIFSVGFISIILIYYYLGVNTPSDYINSISILYYSGLSSLLIYFDQIFSYQYNGPINIKSTNIKLFDNYSKGSLLFQKDSINSSKQFTKSSKVKFVEKESSSYMYMRPSYDKKGNMILIPATDFSGNNSKSHSSIKLPSAPKPSNLSTPSTISPLFNSEISNSSSHKPDNIRNVSTNHNINNNSTMPANKRTSLVSNPRDIDYSSIKRRIIEDVKTKIKEAETTKETKITKKVKLEQITPCKRMLSASK
jgi:hypothetical protein